MKLLACCLLFSGAAAMAQLPSTPPIRMGLWQSESSVKVTGAGMPADSPAETQKVQACVTAASWKSFLGNTESMKNCTRSHETYSGRTYSVDIICPKSGDSPASATGHLEMVFDTEESAHASMHLAMDPGDGKPMTMNATLVSKYVGESCGNIKPGESKDMH